MCLCGGTSRILAGVGFGTGVPGRCAGRDDAGAILSACVGEGRERELLLQQRVALMNFATIKPVSALLLTHTHTESFAPLKRQT